VDTIKVKTKNSYLGSLFKHKCARCRAGDMFKEKRSYQLKRFMQMHEKCPVCEQRLEVEPGFYYGTGYVSYALTVALSAASFVAWCVIIGVSLDDNRFFWWMGCNAVLLILLQPYLMRLSRAVWLSFFVRYDSNWQQVAFKPDDDEGAKNRKMQQAIK
jgi:hypothetical protein